MKKINSPPIILIILFLSLAYWIYLAYSTTMEISCDALGYQYLGRLLQHNGFLNFLQTGPHREPLYPCLVAVSMHLETFFKIPYTKIMAGFGVLTLLLTQLLTYKILKQLNVRTGICAMILGYIALSPSLTNTAFSLYSEIATYPLILGIILASFHAGKALEYRTPKNSVMWGLRLGLLLMALTLIKAVLEYITPLYLFFILVYFLFNQRFKRTPLCLLLFFLSTATVYYLPITGYKLLNQKYNGNFEITNRGPLSIYGVTTRRMEPLTLKKFLVATSYIPGEGACKNFFSDQECSFWSSLKSDELSYEMLDQLNSQYPSQPAKVNKLMLDWSLDKIKHNPIQYSLFCFLETLKMPFWESTKIGFVTYPSWLEYVYNTPLLKKFLRLLMSMLTLFAFLSCLVFWFKGQQTLLGPILIFILLFLLMHSFFVILPRYILPIAPLYLICLGYSLHSFFVKRK